MLAEHEYEREEVGLLFGRASQRVVSGKSGNGRFAALVSANGKT